MYDLELDRIISEIRKKKAKTILIQLPDGLKPEAGKIAEHIEKNTKCQAFIWLNSCFGGCDIPITNTKIDLIVQFGHNQFIKEQW